MKTVTADTNIYVSAFVHGGRLLELIELARAGSIGLAITDDIHAETRRILRDKFNWPEEDLSHLDAEFVSFTVRVQPSERLAIVKADPADDRVLECAVASQSSSYCVR